MKCCSDVNCQHVALNVFRTLKNLSETSLRSCECLRNHIFDIYFHLQLPTIIADNAGYDSADLVAQLRAVHQENKTTFGLSECTWNTLVPEKPTWGEFI